MTQLDPVPGQNSEKLPVAARLRRALGRAIGSPENDNDSRGNKTSEVEEPSTIESLRSHFVELYEQGFTEISSAAGPWIVRTPQNGQPYDARIIPEHAAYHPDGRVVTATTYKTYTDSGHTMRSMPYRLDFPTEEAYAEHVAEWELKVSKKGSLSDEVGNKDS